MIDRGPDGRVRGANLLALVPALRWAGLLSPMPVFFVAAGWAASGSHRSGSFCPFPAAVDRARSVTLLVLTVTVVWAVIAALEQTVTGRPGVLTDGARLATQPLWFAAAYVPFLLAGRVLARAGVHSVLWCVGSTTFVALSDCARFLAGLPTWCGFPGFFVVWSVPWVIGATWRGKREVRGRRETATGLVLLASGAVVCAVLVRWFGYAGTLIDAVPGRRSNSTPPTLFTLMAAVSQSGALMTVAGQLDVLSRRWPRAVASVGRAAAAVYAWHLSALALTTLPIVVGLPFPSRFTTAWWLLRPAWTGAVLLVLLVIVRSTRARNGMRPPREGSQGVTAGGWTVAVAAALVGVGAGLLGLRGPTNMQCSAWIVVLLAGGWRLLGGRSKPAGWASTAG